MSALRNDLYLPFKAPPDNDPATLSKSLNDYFLQQARLYEKVLLNNNLSPLRVPDTTINAGSAIYTFASAVNAGSSLARSALPTMVSTTSNVFQTALNYTGKGILQAVYGVSQDVSALSTAAGMSVQITIDGHVLYSAAALSAKNTGIMVVGQLGVDDPTNDYLLMLSDPIGLTYNKSVKVEYKSGTNGQGVSLGLRNLKLH